MRRESLNWLLVAVCLSSAGCSLGGVADTILETHFLDILLSTMGYLIVGGGLGFLLGILGYFVVKRAGGYAWEWRFAKWFRRLAALLIVATTTTAGSLAGGCIGLASGVESFLIKGEQANGTLAKCGEPMADFAYYLLIVSERQQAAAQAELDAKARGEPHEATSSDEIFAYPQAELEAFQGGEALALARVEGFAERMPHRAGAETFAEVVDEFIGNESHEPTLEHQMLKESIEFLIEYGLEREAKRSAGKGAIRIVKRSLDLGLASAREGKPDWLTRPELAQHFADELYAPLMVLILRKALIPYRWGSYAVLVLAPLLPIPLFWLARYLARRRAAARLTKGESPEGEEAASPEGEPPSLAADKSPSESPQEDPEPPGSAES
jgi:hypothetical protein